MNNKEKCRQLKEIRKSMADELGIDLHQVECTYKGECSGTCPKCRSEENMLNKALLAGAIALSGVSLAACGADVTGDVPNPNYTSENNVIDTSLPGGDSDDVLSGIVEAPNYAYEDIKLPANALLKEDIYFAISDYFNTTDLDFSWDGYSEYLEVSAYCKENGDDSSENCCHYLYVDIYSGDVTEDSVKVLNVKDYCSTPLTGVLDLSDNDN